MQTYNSVHRVNLEEHVFRYVDNSTLSTTVVNSTFAAVDNNTSTTSVESPTLLWWSISRQMCVVVFAVLTFAMILATLIRSATFVSVCMKASMTLHNKMFNAITRATMYFFNTNSSGKLNDGKITL